MSYYFFFTGEETSELCADYNPPIVLDQNSNYEIGLTNFSVNNSIPNVDEDNNKFYYGNSNDFVEIPVGSYELSDISKFLNNYFDNLKKKNPKKDSIHLRLEANLNTLKCELKSSVDIDFTKSNSIGRLLGFKPTILPKDVIHYSDFPVDIMRINMIRIECNIVTNSFSNGNMVHTIHSFYPTDPPGYKIVESPHNVIYLPINTHIIHNISIKIVDQYDRPVNFRKEVLCVTLHLRKI